MKSIWIDESELDALCGALERNRLFVVIEEHSVEQAEALVHRCGDH